MYTPGVRVIRGQDWIWGDQGNFHKLIRSYTEILFPDNIYVFSFIYRLDLRIEFKHLHDKHRIRKAVQCITCYVFSS